MVEQNNIRVQKRDGRIELLDLDKFHRVLMWAAEGLDDVSVSQVELKSKVQFTDMVKTSDIHDILIKTAADLISEYTPDYQYMAARLLMFSLRKEAYGEFQPPHLLDQVKRLVDLKLYDPSLLEMYNEKEYDELNDYIDHNRDFNIAYTGLKQMQGKYLIQNRVTKRVYESPQMLYMLIGMTLFHNYPKETRLHYVKRFYDYASQFKLTLPTPILGGVRTPTRQYSSCVLIEAGDSLDSINATSSAIVKYISQRAGIGISGGRIRAIGSPIRNGEAVHTGTIPFFKYFQTAVKSCSQGERFAPLYSNV